MTQRRVLAEDLEQELQFSAVRSRGPGGQNVNKVSSAAIAYWNFEQSFLLSFFEKGLIRQKLSSYINKEGQLFIRSEEYRDLPRNKQRCVEKIQELLQRAFHKDKPRRATKPTKSSRIKKKESKLRRSDIKKNRKKIL
jgi:ribosome-associated protein